MYTSERSQMIENELRSIEELTRDPQWNNPLTNHHLKNSYNKSKKIIETAMSELDALTINDITWMNSQASSPVSLPEGSKKDCSTNPEKNKRVTRKDFFSALPDCAKFEIKTQGKNQVLKSFGITVNNPPTLTIIPYKNSKINKYLKNQKKLLWKSKTASQFWKRAWNLMSKSTIFTVWAVSKVYPRFHREMKYSSLIALCLGPMKIAKERSIDLNYKRVYIPKATGGKRPLGVPSPVWRIHLCLLTEFLSMSTTKFKLFPKWQHAYTKNKGVLSCWRELLKLLDKKNIYEFDLKKFFDKVPVSKTLSKIKAGITKETANHLYGLSMNTVNNMRVKTWKTPEKEECFEEIDWDKEFSNVIYVEWPSRDEAECEDYITQLEKEMLGVPDKKRYAWIARTLDEKMKMTAPLKGFPQGGAHSAILSVLSLRDLKFTRGVQPLMYADDGLLFSDWSKDLSKEAKESFERCGAEVNDSKSKWIKKEGKWLSPIKFLGLELDMRKGFQLKSKTRAGTSLELSDSMKTLVTLLKNNKAYTKWEEW